jgi:hypothetical protein
MAADGTGPWKNTTGAMVWADLSAGGGGASPFVATNEFWTDVTIVDSPTYAALRMFSLIELALAYINGGGLPPGEEFVIRTRESQNHVWDGTGWLGDRAGTIYGCGGSPTTTQAFLDVSANLTLVGANYLTIRNMTIVGGGTALIDPASTTITLDNCYVGDVLEFSVFAMTIMGNSVSENSSFYVSGTLDVHDSTITGAGMACDLGTYNAHNTHHSGGTRWTNAGGEGSDYTINLYDCTVDETLAADILFDGGGNRVIVNAIGTTIKAVTSGASYIVRKARGCTFTDVSFDVSSAAAGVLYLFSNGGLTQTLNDVRLSWVGPGTVGYHNGFVVTQNNGFTNLGTTITNQPSGTYYNDGAGFVAVEP